MTPKLLWRARAAVSGRGLDVWMGIAAAFVIPALFYAGPEVLPWGLRFVLAFFGLLFVPGHLVLKVAKRDRLDVVERAAFSLSFSLLVLLPAVLLAYLFQFTLAGFLWAYVLTVLVLTVAVALREAPSPEASKPHSLEYRSVLGLMLILAAVGAVLVYVFSRYIPPGWDVFVHMSSARKLLELPRITPYDAANYSYLSGTAYDYGYTWNVWELVTAAIFRVAQADFTQSWQLLAALMVPYSLAAKYFLARTLFGEENERAAWIAVVVFWVWKFVYTTGRTETIYLQFLNQPGPVTGEILMPVAIGCLVLYVRRTDRTWLWLGATLVPFMLYLHAIEWFNTMAILSLAALILWIRGLKSKDYSVARRQTWTVLASVAVGFVILAIPLKGYVFIVSPIPSAGTVTQAHIGDYITVFGDRLILRPSFEFADKMIILGLIALVPVLLSRVNIVAKAVCACAPLMLVLVCFNPILTPIIFDVLSGSVVQRAWEGPLWMMTVTFVAFRLIDPIVEGIPHRFRLLRQLSLTSILAGTVVGSMALAAETPWGFPVKVKGMLDEQSTYGAADEFDRSPIVTALRGIPPGSEVFTELSAGYRIPAFVPVYVNTFRVADQAGAARTADAKEAFDPRTPLSRVVEIVAKYDSEYVLLSKRDGNLQVAWKFDAVFERLFGDSDWVLYRVSETAVADASVSDADVIDFMERIPEASVVAPENSMRNGILRTEEAGFPLRPAVALFPTNAPSRLEFPVRFTSNSVLQFGVHMDATSYRDNCSDGACFGVDVRGGDDPERVFSHCLTPQTVQQDSSWHDFTVDLSAYAGRQATLAFVTTAGPQDNASCDYAYWSTLLLQQLSE